MLKDMIRPDRLRALERVEAFIRDNPHSNTQQIGTALAMKKTTLNGYTQALRELGRVVQSRHKNLGRLGAQQDTFELLADLAPLGDAPLPLPRRRKAVVAAVPPEPARRMDLVAALFGPAMKGTP
jgi:hypothetical protein